MAAADSMNSLVGLGNLISTITGKSGSQSTTQTSQGNISDEGMNRLLQQILAGKGGVKDISGAARGAGLYNSSTELQLQNDLAARAAGEVEARRAGTTTTSTTDTSQDGIGIGSLLAPMVGMQLAKPLLDQAMGLVTGSNTAPVAGAASAPLSNSSMVSPTAGAGYVQAGQATGDVSNMATAAQLAGNSAGINNVLSGLTLGGSGAAVQGAGALGGNLASDLGMSFGDAASGASTALSGASGAAGGFGDLISNVPIIGNVLSGFLGGQGGDPFGNPFGLASSMAGGAMAMGPLGMIAAPVAATFGMMLSDLGLSVVCTALKSYGHLDPKEYAQGQEYLKSINPTVIKGYYHWGVPLAYKIHKENGAGRWTKLALPWARSRTKLIAAGSGYLRFLRYPLGTLTIVVGQPICYAIGSLLNLRDKLETKAESHGKRI